jgi:hypothetical protein
MTTFLREPIVYSLGHGSSTAIWSTSTRTGLNRDGNGGPCYQACTETGRWVRGAFLDVLPEGHVLIERALNRSTLLLPDKPRPEAHPHLSSTAVLGWWWLGRNSFNASGFIVEGNVWGFSGNGATV